MRMALDILAWTGAVDFIAVSLLAIAMVITTIMNS